MADAVRNALNSAASEVLGQEGLRLWEARADGDGRSVREEAMRPLARSGSAVRAVLAWQQDGSAELILVARRPEVTANNLWRLAAAVADLAGSTKPVLTTLPPVPVSWRADVPWGLPDLQLPDKVGTVSLRVAEGDEQLLVAAAVLVLARYQAGREVRVATIREGSFFIRAYSIDERIGVRDYLAEFGSPTPGDAEDGMHTAPLAVLFADLPEHARYLPFLMPPFPLTFLWERHADGSFDGTCWYDQGAVSPVIATSFARHVERLTCSLAASGVPTLSDLELLTSAERAAILWSGTARTSEPSEETRIDRLFAQVAGRWPDALAVRDDQTSLNYRELDAMADRLAAGLLTRSASVGDRIGVCLEPGVTSVAMFLAVLKADRTYVPMDVRHPADRLRYIVADAGIPLVVAEPDVLLLEGVPQVSPDELEACGSDVTGQTGRTELPQVDRTAYVIYTSGSTGRPKGVAIPHTNVTALVASAAIELELTQRDVWTLFHSSAFDFSVWEIWGCLLTGGALVVVPYWTSRSPREFRALLHKARVTVLSQTPSAFGQLIAAGQADEAPPLRPGPRLVVLGGESLDTRLLRHWFTDYPASSCRVVNMYGITETTVHVTAYTVLPRDTTHGSQSVGRALPGWEVSVRDERGQVLPWGVEGEICVAGVGLAQRYLGLPELTAERFAIDFPTGRRFYRSGDRGRLHPDGTLDHLGRLDEQVKIRGHRIELGEIRGVLMEASCVFQAAVVVRDAGTAAARVDAYLVLTPGGTVAEVRAYCRRLLPDHMVPVGFIVVENLPTTVNGKLDVAALPVFDTPVADGFGSVENLGTMLGTIIPLWSRHLKVEVTAEDNFFELGGNSLLVVRVLEDLARMGLPEVTVAQFYRASRASDFAALLESLIITKSRK